MACTIQVELSSYLVKFYSKDWGVDHSDPDWQQIVKKFLYP